MPLYDADRDPAVEPEDAVIVVHRFMQRCRAWATDREIPKRIDRVAESLRPEDAAKLHAWIAYLQFTEHVLSELEDGTLDHWFTGENASVIGSRD